MAKANKCNECRYFDDKNCVHKKNIGIKIKYKQQSEFYILTPDKINKDGKCELYAKFPEK